MQRQRVAAYADIRDPAGRILLAQTVPAIGTRWFLPGGGVEFGEHPEDAARREVTEETGLTVVDLELRDVVSDVIELVDQTLHSIRCIYAATVADPLANLRVEVGGSTGAVAWFTLAATADLNLAGFLAAYLSAPLNDA